MSDEEYLLNDDGKRRVPKSKFCLDCWQSMQYDTRLVVRRQRVRNGKICFGFCVRKPSGTGALAESQPTSAEVPKRGQEGAAEEGAG